MANRLMSEEDIPAIAVLSAEIQSIKQITDPPLEYSAIGNYKQKTEEVFKKAQHTINDVSDYADRISKKNDELRGAVQKTKTRVNEAIMHLIDRALNESHDHGPRGRDSLAPSRELETNRTVEGTRGRQDHSHDSRIYENDLLVAHDQEQKRFDSVLEGRDDNSAQTMQCIFELLQLNKIGNTLEEAILQTQLMLDKLKNNFNLTNGDFESLRDKIINLQSAEKREVDNEKHRKYQEERTKKAADEEKRQRDMEKKKREDERQIQKNEAERKRQSDRLEREQEKERKRREEEEEERRKEEERRLRQEGERIKRENEQEEAKRKKKDKRKRKRLEKEEKQKLQAEERQRRLEEERMRRDEEEQRKRLEEEERRRKEEEERKQREEEEKEREETKRKKKDKRKEKRLEKEEKQKLQAEERQRRLEEEEQRKRLEEEEKRRKEREERKQREKEREKTKIKINDERERKRREEEEKQKLQEEERQRKLKEERMRRDKKEQRKRLEEEERRRKLEEERKQRDEEEKEREEANRKMMVEMQRKRLEEEEKQKLQEEERQRKLEEERMRRDEEEQRKRLEEEERRRELEEERKQREEEEKQKLQDEERQRKLEEERMRRDEEEQRKRLEEEERRRKGEEERKQREEEEKEREEAKRLEKLQEEERQRKLEEETMRREEEEHRKRLEEEEKRRKGEEERKQREEEERQRQLEEEQRKKRKYQERLEAERKERERKKRLDPNNWSPIIYKRNDGGEDPGSHHQGVCCVATAIQNSLQEKDILCIATDDADDLVLALGDGEKVVSSIVSVNSKKGNLNFEAPMRVFIPYRAVTNYGEELVVKVSKDGSNWTMSQSVELRPGHPLLQNIRLIGVELDGFESAKLVAIVRSKGEKIIVDKTGTSQFSSSNKHVKLVVPRNAYKDPTEVTFSVKTILDEVRQTIEAGSDCIGSIITIGPLVNLDTPTPPKKQVEIDILTSSDSVRSHTPRGKAFQMFKTNKGSWQMADVEYKGKTRHVSLPADKTNYGVVEAQVTPSTSAEDVIKLAGAVYDCMNKSVVRLIVKQKEQSPEHVLIQCLRRDVVSDRLKELTTMGYTAGPDTSREFFLADGQKLKMSCSGNIQPSLEGRDHVMLTFFAYMDTAKVELAIHVKDQYKQKDLFEYQGSVRCQVVPFRTNATNAVRIELDMELPVFLPKHDRHPLFLETVPVKFPHYWTALTVFLAWQLTDIHDSENGIDWRSVLSDLVGGKRKMQRLHGRAKAKISESGDMEICRVMLEDWMKATNVYDDKLGPVLVTLNHHGLQQLGQECAELVVYHKDYMNDAIMKGLADRIQGGALDIGARLSLSPSDVEKCIAENHGSRDAQVTSMLVEWRNSLGAIELRTKAMDYLQSIVNE